MAEIGLTWRADAFVRATVREMVPRMQRAMQALRNRTVQLLNRSQPTRRLPSGRRVGLAPSKPGEPPKRLESQLIKSITTDVRVEPFAVIGRFGTPDRKARRLELGFVGTDSAGRNVTQLPRPFLRRALAEGRAETAALLGAT